MPPSKRMCRWLLTHHLQVFLCECFQKNLASVSTQLIKKIRHHQRGPQAASNLLRAQTEQKGRDRKYLLLCLSWDTHLLLSWDSRIPILQAFGLRLRLSPWLPWSSGPFSWFWNLQMLHCRTSQSLWACEPIPCDDVTAAHWFSVGMMLPVRGWGQMIMCEYVWVVVDITKIGGALLIFSDQAPRMWEVPHWLNCREGKLCDSEEELIIQPHERLLMQW